MIQYGFAARQFGGHKVSFLEEVELAKEKNFDLIQVWYDAKNGLEIRPKNNKEAIIKNSNFPTIIHAVLDIDEIETEFPCILELLEYFGHKELIIHPKDKGGQGIQALSYAIRPVLDKLKSEKIKLHLENNSKLSPIFSTTEEIKFMFSQLPDLEFLIDLAHIDNYEHLKEMAAIKYPKILHIADRHFNVVHEHLPIGKGEIDFDFIFKNILKDYDRKIIFEVSESAEALINSKDRIISILNP